MEYIPDEAIVHIFVVNEDPKALGMFRRIRSTEWFGIWWPRPPTVMFAIIFLSADSPLCTNKKRTVQRAFLSFLAAHNSFFFFSFLGNVRTIY
jgi:hypothetical protein